MPLEHVDVLIVGAGLSGIGAGCHLTARCPGKSFAIFAGRESSGGTWDLFRYPGVRSDSDMFTLGYPFRPWQGSRSIVDGASILNYVRETARTYGIDRHIRFRHRVRTVSWSTHDAVWTVEAESGPGKENVRITCDFLFMCCGYYDYEQGYTPDFPGIERFGGRIVHPQQWPGDLDHAGKSIVVIGSGATAVTLVPALAETAGHVVMLQRSPTYVVSRPSDDPLARWLRRRVPSKLAFFLARWWNVLFSIYFFDLTRRKPERVKKFIIDLVRKHLGPDYDVATHFTPSYNPWDQRLCLVPDADLFESIRAGRASIVTDHVETFTERGVRLRSGRELEADLVVTATGLRMQLLSGMRVVVDGAVVDFANVMSYKGMMFSDVPNFAFALGYANASWTLKSDLTCEYVCRLLNFMGRRGYAQCTPKRDPAVRDEPIMHLTSGYVQRALAYLPRQGNKRPWKLHRNYALDLFYLRCGGLRDGTMKFSRRERPARQAA